MRVFIVSHTLGQAERLRDLLSHYEVESHLEKAKRFREAMDQPVSGSHPLHRSPLLRVSEPTGGMGAPDRRGDLW